MSTPIELDEQRHRALEQVARRRKVPVRRLLERAVDEFIERAEGKELSGRSTHTAKRTGLRKKGVDKIERELRSKDRKERYKLNTETIKQGQRSGLTENEDIENVIKDFRKKRLAKA